MFYYFSRLCFFSFQTDFFSFLKRTTYLFGTFVFPHSIYTIFGFFGTKLSLFCLFFFKTNPNVWRIFCQKCSKNTTPAPSAPPRQFVSGGLPAAPGLRHQSLLRPLRSLAGAFGVVGASGGPPALNALKALKALKEAVGTEGAAGCNGFQRL